VAAQDLKIYAYVKACTNWSDLFLHLMMLTAFCLKFLVQTVSGSVASVRHYDIHYADNVFGPCDTLTFVYRHPALTCRVSMYVSPDISGLPL